MNAAMSAVLQPRSGFEPMTEEDLVEVMAVESRIYEFPWTSGNFRDSIRAAYSCWVYRDASGLIGYSVAMIASGEAHLLNLSIAESHQGQGHGGRLLAHMVGMARERGARYMFLEVRPSNRAGQRLYAREGFKRIGLRRDYYPAASGREDALVFAREL